MDRTGSDMKLTPFTTNIYVYNNFLTEEEIAFARDFIYKQQEATPSVMISNRGGWQSPTKTAGIDEFDSEMQPIFIKTLTKTLEIFREYGIERDVFLKDYWFNINKKGNFNNRHVHPFSNFSAVLYIQAPENCGNIVFERADDFENFIQTDHRTDDSRINCYIIPSPGDLIVFPSYLPHYVDPSESNEDRISIALNIKGA
jgi:uncharacterized protein (TIGR02466 family)